jgi:hypothetical protein
MAFVLLGMSGTARKSAWSERRCSVHLQACATSMWSAFPSPFDDDTVWTRSMIGVPSIGFRGGFGLGSAMMSVEREVSGRLECLGPDPKTRISS